MASGFSLGKLFSKRIGGARSPKDVTPGMRYRQTRQLGSIWVVKRPVKTLGNDLPHVMIAREDAEHETRVIAVAALRDPHYYRFVQPEEIPAEETTEGPKPLM